MQGSFKDFAETCERVKATSSKIEKVAILAEYLRKLADPDLRIAVTFLTGRAFPKGDPRDPNVGYSTIASIILEITGADELQLYETYKKYGDLGETIFHMLSKRAQAQLLMEPLTLQRVYRAFDKIASISGAKAATMRSTILRGLLLSATPLEAKYIVKVLTSELRIGAIEGLIEEAIASAFGEPLERVRNASLAINDLGEVAVLAKQKQLHNVKVTPLKPAGFMLAETAQTPEEVIEYFKKPVLADFKYDGARAQIHKKSSTIRIFSRRLEEVSAFFPEIVEAVKKISGTLILDGEILPMRDGKPLPFQVLQRRLHRKKITRRLLEEIPLHLFLYDVLYYGDSPVVDKPLAERRQILEQLSLPDNVHLSEMHEVKDVASLRTLFEKSKAEGFEGLVVKDPGSPYILGRRGKHWLKLKKELDTLDVVIVGAEYGHGKRAGILSDYIFAVRDDEGRFRVIGKAYSGLTDEEMLELSERLKSMVIKDLGMRVLVRPEIVIEVAFDGIQKSDRHDSGFALRFPRIKRLRPDKGPDEIDTLKRVEGIYRRQMLYETS
ncbi:MAG: ATP-dependent DNA ligase [Candidatus Verstraetearchaeota archaeon]|nr:ATP-dependent DNA ligase [Candidatus Verstraetearchaeota archaeon]